MIDNVFLINQQSQIRELASPLKFRILEELILNPATCQQLADLLGISKQKTHYNLMGLMGQGLIRIDREASNNKEVYYRAKARNYVLDFSMGLNIGSGPSSNRDIMNSILQKNHGIDLAKIAANILENSLKLRPQQRLLVTTGKLNMPLVEKLLLEAGRRQIITTLLYQDQDIIRAKNGEYSLSAYRHDYEHFNHLLRSHDVFLNLNGESRYIPVTDPEKLSLRQRAFAKSREIMQKHNVRAAVMPGLMKDTLSEHDIVSEINFWKGLDVDFDRLYRITETIARNILRHKTMQITNNGGTFRFQIERVVCEFGSFQDSPLQSPIINLPGGKVLVVPKAGTFEGDLFSGNATAYGEHIPNPRITLRDGQIDEYQADDARLITQAIREGGRDGRKVALVWFSTNYNLGLGTIDTTFKHIGPGLVSVYWGENVSFGGTVRGETEWQVGLDKPEIVMSEA